MHRHKKKYESDEFLVKVIAQHYNLIDYIQKDKNDPKMLTEEQFQLLLKRNRIENVWSVMKLNYNLIYHRARSVTGMFRHFFYSISAFLFHLVDDVKQWFLPNYQSFAKLEF